ncbi:hypothetical protein [Bacillus massilioanorexius]|nr:hypothetical protein [Bacillus massilioanorexius]
MRNKRFFLNACHDLDIFGEAPSYTFIAIGDKVGNGNFGEKIELISFSV